MNTILIEKKPFNSNVIKLIAIIAMTIDHITWAVFPGFDNGYLPIILHLLGRITCPIMCYCVAEGYHYTKNLNKYIFRMFLFAFISHFAYIFASNGYIDAYSFIPFYYGDLFNQTSVMWSLSWGLVLLKINDNKNINNSLKILSIILISIIALPADWSSIPALVIMGMGLNRDKIKVQIIWLLICVTIYSVVYIIFIDCLYGVLQMGAMLSVPVIFFYNGQKGKSMTVNKILKWLFYIYYPLHLFIIGLLL